RKKLDVPRVSRLILFTFLGSRRISENLPGTDLASVGTGKIQPILTIPTSLTTRKDHSTCLKAPSSQVILRIIDLHHVNSLHGQAMIYGKLRRCQIFPVSRISTLLSFNCQGLKLASFI